MTSKRQKKAGFFIVVLFLLSAFLVNAEREDGTDGWMDGGGAGDDRRIADFAREKEVA